MTLPRLAMTADRPTAVATAKAVGSLTVEAGGGIVVVASDPAWARDFTNLGGLLRRFLAEAAVRIDHIGSTAVPGLDAKPVIDIQISVEMFDPLDTYRLPIEAAGFVHQPDNSERTKRYFRERPGARRTHIHVRRAGSFSEQFALLFRDYLRADTERASEYGALKHALAARYARPEERHQYVEAKVPFIWETMRMADQWAQMNGWHPTPSDA